MASRFSALNYTTEFHDVSAIWGRFKTVGREADIEPGDIMGWAANNITPRGSLGSIMEGVSEKWNSESEVIGGHDGDRQTDCRFCYNW